MSYSPGSAGAANLASDHARLFIPSAAFEDVISNMLEDWEGLGGSKGLDEVLEDARRAAEGVDMSAPAGMEDRFR